MATAFENLEDQVALGEVTWEGRPVHFDGGKGMIGLGTSSLPVPVLGFKFRVTVSDEDPSIWILADMVDALPEYPIAYSTSLDEVGQLVRDLANVSCGALHSGQASDMATQPRLATFPAYETDSDNSVEECNVKVDIVGNRIRVWLAPQAARAGTPPVATLQGEVGDGFIFAGNLVRAFTEARDACEDAARILKKSVVGPHGPRA